MSTRILNASDEILDVIANQGMGRRVRIQLKLHRDYLLSPYFLNSGYLEQYEPRFQTFLDAAAGRPSHKPPVQPNVARIDTPRKEGKEACLSSSSTTKSTTCRTASR